LASIANEESAAVIPAFVNYASGRAAAVSRILTADPRFLVREMEPARIAIAVRAAVARAEPRVLVAGGDGTIAVAAQELVGSRTELAVVPAGTLNHFARDQGIPLDTRQALDLAAQGEARGVDVGYANDRLFLNTCSVGAYVDFVRHREAIERRVGYWIASVVSTVRMLARLRTYGLELEVDGRPERYSTPLVFLGVDERETRMPVFGRRLPQGRAGLHLIVVQTKARARMLTLAVAAAARGLRPVSRTTHLDSFLVESCRIELPKSVRYVALDGEMVALESPLEFRVERAALRVVTSEEE
jgi:diacylglycerol kinase family enzyme